MQLLASFGVKPGNWVVDGNGISPAAVQKPAAHTDAASGKCCYVLDVLLCD